MGSPPTFALISFWKFFDVCAVGIAQNAYDNSGRGIFLVDDRDPWESLVFVAAHHKYHIHSSHERSNNAGEAYVTAAIPEANRTS